MKNLGSNVAFTSPLPIPIPSTFSINDQCRKCSKVIISSSSSADNRRSNSNINNSSRNFRNRRQQSQIRSQYQQDNFRNIDSLPDGDEYEQEPENTAVNAVDNDVINEGGNDENPTSSLEDDSRSNNETSYRNRRPSSNRNNSQRYRRNSNIANKEAATSAFEAVDRLFGFNEKDRKPYFPSSSTSSPPPTRPLRIPRSSPRASSNQDNTRANDYNSQSSSSQIDRRTWLEDVKARGATKNATRTSSSSSTSIQNKELKYNDADTVDVDAVEDTTEDDYSDADIVEDSHDDDDDDDDGDNEDSVDEKEDSKIEANEEGQVLNGNSRIETPRAQKTSNYPPYDKSLRDYRQSQNFYSSSYDENVNRRPRTRRTDANDTAEYITEFKPDIFDTLMQVVKNGPAGDHQETWKRKSNQGNRISKGNYNKINTDDIRHTATSNNSNNKSARNNTTTMSATTREKSPSTNKTLSNVINNSTNDGNRNYTNESGKPSDLSQRLNEIISGRHVVAKTTDDDYEPADDEMSQVIDIDKYTTNLLRRQRFSSVRRNGPYNSKNILVKNLQQSRSVLEPPKEWEPMEADDISSAEIKSDGRSLRSETMNFSKRGAISSCADCEGMGLESCGLCLGEGWIESLSSLNSNKNVDAERMKLLDQVWMRPNLVVNSVGAAQCVKCNGLGKQFCGKCEGSGSSSKKGFDESEYYEIFDLFGGSKDGPDVDLDEIHRTMGDYNLNDDDVEEEDDDESDVNGDDLESFQLYTGSADLSSIFGNSGLRKEVDKIKNSTKSDDVDLSGIEDESAELLATLEAMHVADLEDRDLSLDARLGIRSKPLKEGDDSDDNVVPIEEDDGLEIDIDDVDVIEDVHDIDDVNDMDDVNDVEDINDVDVVDELDDEDLDDDLGDYGMDDEDNGLEPAMLLDDEDEDEDEDSDDEFDEVEIEDLNDEVEVDEIFNNEAENLRAFISTRLDLHVMGFGICSYKRAPALTDVNDIDRRRRPSTGQQKSRPGECKCRAFYWDISSVVLKSACLSTFFFVESPRRILSYATRKPEPKPYFVCSNWGYRMCVCGHHYYEHGDGTKQVIAVTPSNKPTPNLARLKDTQALKGTNHVTEITSEQSSLNQLVISTKDESKKKRRRFFWPFG